jgi:hypothetical protein
MRKNWFGSCSILNLKEVLLIQIWRAIDQIRNRNEVSVELIVFALNDNDLCNFLGVHPIMVR